MKSRDSVFLRALGDEARKLHPQVWEYVAGPPAGFSSGTGHGLFEIAGSPYRRLAWLLRIVCGPEVALTSYERDVPFHIINRPLAHEGTVTLAAERTFQFQRGAQQFVDTLRVGLEPGTLVNTPGTTGRIDLLLSCSVTPEGNLRLTSRAARIRIGSRRVRLPKLLSVQADVIDGWDSQQGRRTVDVRVRNPILGTVMRYRGWFHYEYLPDAESGAEGTAP